MEKEKVRVIQSYKDLVKIPKKLLQMLPTSFDTVGDIILIKIKDEIIDYKKQIAEALINTHKNIKTICMISPVGGELRTRKLEIIGGENRTITVHKEYGLKFFIDLEKMYFSSRLANERKRIANLVKKGEIIVDMFTGVAPFSIMIAKYAEPKIIFAFDKNKNAIKYAKENIKKNNVLDKIEIINIDASKSPSVLKQKKVQADRIIMNLPFSAFNFFPIAIEIMADTCVIHYFDILSEDEIAMKINKLKKLTNNSHIVIEKTKVRKIKSYSPREFYIGIDITAKRKTYADVAQPG